MSVLEALARLAARRYDVFVLDRDLPGTHGNEICCTPADPIRYNSVGGLVEVATRIMDGVETAAGVTSAQ